MESSNHRFSLCSSAEFLSLVRIIPVTERVYQYNALTGLTERCNLDIVTPTPTALDHTYTRKAAVIICSLFDANSIMRHFAASNCHVPVSKRIAAETDAEAAVNAAIINCMYNYGNPQVYVRVSPRKWLLANPEDLRLIQNNNKAVLVCYSPLHCHIIEWTK